MKLPAFVRLLFEYRYWLRRGYPRETAWRKARNTFY